MKLIYLLPFLMLMLSCKNEKQEKLEKDILGEWKFIKDFDSIANDSLIPPPLAFTMMFDFAVLNDALYIDKGGFSWDDETHGYDKRVFHYSGNKTRYKIEDDSLMVFIPHFKKWSPQKIYSIKGDTLILERGPKLYRKFIRQHYHLNPSEKYDQIIISSSGCYGTCPIADVSIAANGKVVYQGRSYNLKNGNYNGMITTGRYLELEREFKKAGIDTLKTAYLAGFTDSQTITATFIRNGRIYKTIYDYGFQAPSEFIAACNQARFLYQQLQLENARLTIPELREGYLGFNTADKSLDLLRSEQFYFITELEKARPVGRISFKSKFTLQYGDYDHKKFMETDGRYYKFPTEDGGKILDLGYNFIERNRLEQQFKSNDAN